MHSPGDCRAMAAVSSAEARLLSTASTLAPSCANRTTVARPLPRPSPGDWPAPTTMAILSSRRMSTSLQRICAAAYGNRASDTSPARPHCPRPGMPGSLDSRQPCRAPRRGAQGGSMPELSKVPSVRQRVSTEEWQARVDLAAAYRLVAHYGWTHLINNHISLRVPGTQDQFLINPYGFRYEQITASSLIKIDVDGNILDDSPYEVNRAGFVIHSAIHMARKDLHAIIHTHTVAGQAVSALDCGLLPLTTSRAWRATSTSARASSPISASTSASSSSITACSPPGSISARPST